MVIMMTMMMLLLQEGWSALLCAAKEGFLEIAIELLEHGAELDHKDMVSL